MASIGYFQYQLRGEKSPYHCMILVRLENQQLNTYVFYVIVYLMSYVRMYVYEFGKEV